MTIDVENTSSVVTGLNVAMTVEAHNGECCDCVEIPTDAEGWWPLDETTGPTAFELLNSHDGTWMEFAAMAPFPFGFPGYVNGAIFLDGIDDFIEVPHHPDLNFGPNEDFSVDAWIWTGSTTRQSIVRKKPTGLPSAPGYAFYAGGTLTLEMGDGTGFVVCNGATNIGDSQWHFVAVTVDRDNPFGIRLIVDGVVDAICDPTSLATGDLSNTEQFYIGAAATVLAAGPAVLEGLARRNRALPPRAGRQRAGRHLPRRTRRQVPAGRLRGLGRHPGLRGQLPAGLHLRHRADAGRHLRVRAGPEHVRQTWQASAKGSVPTRTTSVSRT